MPDIYYVLNLTIFNLPRLSVDIDLDYTRNNNLNEMKLNRQFLNMLKSIITAKGDIQP